MTSVRRNALNQSLFREVNERIRGIAENNLASTELAIVCECGTTGCTTTLPITIEEYQAVRRDPLHFVLAPGHDDPTVETIVDIHAHFVIVRNEGLAARIAQETWNAGGGLAERSIS